ncbi:hypothetical protein DCAR_0415742 [Daucus carota subsp. sativus]|uniref:Uncharacterized protein n=1 Tax=Daucus carota subsp. sativus TaxID=79200 RepID=A0AAF1AX96_DAUCS|nr:hypothetical protein DCAR_0415742 [Daucus carota subsp. sativus]
MEPPRGIGASLWNFICFLPYFIGLLLLGLIKGIILCPLICLIMTTGNSAIILGLWPVHCLWTYYCILSTKQFGIVLKLVLCICIIVPLLLWPLISIVGSIIGGAAFGLLSPIFATFDAVGEGKDDVFFHCIYDGTWETVTGCFTIVRDFGDVCYHSYFSIMDDLRGQGNYYEIRLMYIPGAILIGALGILVDYVVISLVAICKFPYTLFKGWHRLFQDCIGREGPFLETICVPIAGLAILLWPLAVVGALLASVLSSIILGAYAAVIVYQESSLWLGLCYIVASLSIYDEYSNDVLDMPEGSCFPRPQYRKKTSNSGGSSREGSLRKPDSFRKVPSRSVSIKTPLVEVKPLELIDNLFKECKRYGEVMVSEGLITMQDIEDAKSNKGNGKAICTGLAAYGILQSLLRSAKYNSPGILLADNATEITPTNRPRDAFFDWFLNPLLIIKEQIKAEHLSPSEEAYLGKLVLLSGNPDRLKNSDLGTPPESERKRAELDGLARRLHGITKSISRYPTYRRRFDSAIKIISEELAKKGENSNKESSRSRTTGRSKSALAKIFSQKSFKGKPTEADIEAQPVGEREILVQ